MKKIIFTALFNLTLFSLIRSQGTWINKANFPGGQRSAVVGFSIGSKAYIGLGNDVPGIYTDFWEWDKISDVWTQKSDFPAGPRSNVVCFTIGNKGYIGLGTDSTNFSCQQLWEWDQTSDNWTQKANFPGPARSKAVGFAIGNMGYIGMGRVGGILLKDFWEWDQTSDTWTQKANFAGRGRYGASGFSIGAKGFIALGADSIDYWSGYDIYTKDFWEWNQTNDTWTKKADFGGVERYNAAGFSIGTKVYIGTGYHGGCDAIQDFWEWDTATNIWTEKATYPGIGFAGLVGFSSGNKGYLGTGANCASNQQDFWEFDPDVTVEIGKVSYSNSLYIYPNPTNGKFTIETTTKEKEIIEIFDLNGKLVFSQTLTEKTNIDATGLNEGIYNLTIKSNISVSNKKLIIVK